VVYMARDRRTEEFVALKRVRTDSGHEKRTGFPVTSIREIKILQNLDHQNIISLREVVRSKQVGFVFLVFEYFEHDLASLVDHGDYAAFSISEIKCILKQIVSAIKYAHSHFVIHRDIKLSNILLNNHGQIVLCDWGLARLFANPLQQHTSKVVTLWYRAPELLFGSKVYHTAVDMWAIGCIFAELLKHKPLFPGKNEMHQIQLIYELLGAPNHHIWPNYGRLPNVANGTFKEIESRKEQYKWNQIDALFANFGANCLELMKQLLAYDPSKRITASRAELHPFFKEDPVPCTRDMMPTFPAKHQMDRG
jgi:serine/threonine protein kinase